MATTTKLAERLAAAEAHMNQARAAWKNAGKPADGPLWENLSRAMNYVDHAARKLREGSR